jgi:DNA repair protein RadC
MKKKTTPALYASLRKITSIAQESTFEQVEITSSQIAQSYARQFYHEDLVLYESFFIIMMNQANRTIEYAKISQGGVSATVADPRIICKLAVDSLCSAIILVHNHPSGNIQESDSDRSLTKKIMLALSYLDIRLLDHIVLTENNYKSFADDGIMPTI